MEKKKRGRPKGSTNKPNTQPKVKVKSKVESDELESIEVFKEVESEIPIGTVIVTKKNDWYSDNKNKAGYVQGEIEFFSPEMEKFLNKKTQIASAVDVDGTQMYLLKCDPQRRYLFEKEWFDIVEKNKK